METLLPDMGVTSFVGLTGVGCEGACSVVVVDDSEGDAVGVGVELPGVHVSDFVDMAWGKEVFFW